MSAANWLVRRPGLEQQAPTSAGPGTCFLALWVFLGLDVDVTLEIELEAASERKQKKKNMVHVIGKRHY